MSGLPDAVAGELPERCDYNNGEPGFISRR